ncbi:hypothetical protein [Pseudomonas phage PA1C]|nr:hypothetical protein [Pseudomonas phage PA1C]
MTYKRKQSIWLMIIGLVVFVIIACIYTKKHAERQVEQCKKYPLSCQEVVTHVQSFR